MIKQGELENRIQSLQKEIDNISPNICVNLPICNYIKRLNRYLQLSALSCFRNKYQNITRNIQFDYGVHAVALYQKLALAYLMQNSLEQIRPKTLPEKINIELFNWYQRVVNDFTRQSDDYYDSTKNDFIADILVCSLKSLPIGGAWRIEIRRIGFRLFITFNILHLYRILSFLFFRTGGIRNFCIIHTVPRNILRFNCQQMNYAYKQIGELMMHNSKIKGIYRNSWFLNPNLKEISPDLSYLREIPQRNGAKFFKTGTYEQNIRNSLHLSQHRRKLYEEGKYLPTQYAYIWRRKDFLTWLDRSVAEQKM